MACCVLFYSFHPCRASTDHMDHRSHLLCRFTASFSNLFSGPGDGYDSAARLVGHNDQIVTLLQKMFDFGPNPEENCLLYEGYLTMIKDNSLTEMEILQKIHQAVGAALPDVIKQGHCNRAVSLFLNDNVRIIPLR